MSEWILISLNRTEQELQAAAGVLGAQGWFSAFLDSQKLHCKLRSHKREIRLGRRNSHTKPEADTSIISSYTDTTAAVETRGLFAVDRQCPAKRSFSRSQPMT